MQPRDVPQRQAFRRRISAGSRRSDRESWKWHPWLISAQRTVNLDGRFAWRKGNRADRNAGPTTDAPPAGGQSATVRQAVSRETTVAVCRR